MFSIWKKPNSHIAFIFDIGSGAVSGALVKIESNKSPRILYSTRNQIHLSSTPHSDNLLISTAKTLKNVAEKLSKEGYLHLNFSGDRNLPRHYYCFLSSPWSMSETTTIKHEKPDMLFTKSLHESLVGREETNLKKSMISKFQATLPDDTVLIEKKTIDIKLNGYSLSKPFGKTASRIDISLFLGIVSKEAALKFKDVLVHSFPEMRSLRFHTFAFAAYQSLSSVTSLDDFAILDITGEITDIFVIKDSLITENVTFPFARNQLLRLLTSKFATKEAEALSALKMYNEKSLSGELMEKMSEHIKSYGNDFVSTMKEVLGTQLVGKAFIIGDKEIEPLAKEWLKSIPNATCLTLNKSILGNRVRGAPEADTFIVLESIFLSKLNNLHNH